jgi:endonuclease G
MTKLKALWLKLPLILSVLLVVTSCEDDDSKSYDLTINKNQNTTNIVKEATRMEMPHLKGSGTIVLVHSTTDKEGVNIIIEWDVEKKAQRWTAYRIHKGQTGSSGRSNDFKEDPDLPTYARVSDSRSYYSGSGFDRGHICASADRQYSNLANQQTYYYTNMQPQYHMFNAGPRLANGDQDWSKESPWLQLEGLVRSWGRSSGCDTLYIVKGGTIDDDKLLKTSSYPQGKIGGVLPIPKYFFVALLMKTKTTYQAIGFWLEHDNKDHSADDLKKYAMSIDELEALTDIDFFCNLPDATEDEVEKNFAPIKWGL